ncbi:hypothetical protein [Streptomyces aidingensis]|uniref:Uncharacterized protein n=1 Tax=Streptomyces aidingensis TaxID=910347 RepID=A0A1I1Q0G9_9ACTN|nr:hypothetical protein [Streptomyces aidingensis]SFD13358.1 hypothetical protein SAMN05421773_11054 [Streptomyces aidingensis]
MTTTHNPLPVLGLCPVCEGEARIRKTGRLYAHRCAGDGRPPAALLTPTFAHWLHAQITRRDPHVNPVTALAVREFHGCSRRRSPADVPWSTAEELHTEIHARSRTAGAGPCWWLCDDIARAGEIHAGLLAQVGGGS